MSGEAVLVPLIWESITGVADAVQAAVEARKEAARRRAEAQRERIEAWRDFQSRHSEAQAQLGRSRKAVRLAHQQLIGAGLQEAAARETGGPVAEGFVEQAGSASSAQAALMEQIDDQLRSLPSELFIDDRLPFARLRTQLQRMRQGATPSIEEVGALSETLQRTFDDYIQRADREAEQQLKQLAEAEKLLTQILEARELNLNAGDGEALERLQQKLAALLTDGQTTPAALDVVRNQFRALRDKVQRSVAEDEMNDFLAERVTHHLNAMGYTTLSAFSDKRPGERRDAEFALPDGDRVRVALQPDLKMGFQLSHETATMIEKTLSGEALTFFRQQEARWCRDMKELIRRLVKDGVPYEVQFEREVPEASIPVVAVETVDELLEAEEDEYQRRRTRKERTFT
jgi:hypothetical protein